MLVVVTLIYIPIGYDLHTVNRYLFGSSSVNDVFKLFSFKNVYIENYIIIIMNTEGKR